MKLLNETLLCWAIISLVLIFLLQTGGKLVPFFRVYVDGKYVFQGTLVWMIKIVKTFFGCSHLTLEHSAHRKIDLSFFTWKLHCYRKLGEVHTKCFNSFYGT